MGIDHAVILDSVPVGVLQMASTPENLYSWVQKTGCNRHRKYILQKPDLQEKFVSEDTITQIQGFVVCKRLELLGQILYGLVS
jgi:hypothetical protein